MKLKVAGMVLGVLLASAGFAEEESMELKIVKVEQGSTRDGPWCSLTGLLTNKTSLPFQYYTTKLQAYDSDGYLIAAETFSSTR